MAGQGKPEWPEIEEAYLKQLKSLSLSGEDVSNRFEKGEFLREIENVSYYSVHLPDSLYELINLEVLEVNDTGLTRVDYSLTKLKNLKKVSFSRNKLIQTGEWFNHMPNLKHMDLSYNLFEYLPEQLNMPTQEIVDFSHNRLSFIPDISPAECLTHLYLNSNALDHLPEGLMYCKKLQEVNIASNYLEEVDVEYLKKIKSLRILNLSDNEIAKFPASLSECRHIEQLKISGNPIEDERLKEIESSDTKEILDYLATKQ